MANRLPTPDLKNLHAAFRACGTIQRKNND